jgi:hypothetical protein
MPAFSMPTTTFAPARGSTGSSSQHHHLTSPVNTVDPRQRGAPQRLPPLSSTRPSVPRSSSPRHHASSRSPSQSDSSPVLQRTLSRHNSSSLWSTSSQAAEEHLTLPSIWETDDIGFPSTVNLPGLDTPFFTPFPANQDAYEALPIDDDPPSSSSSEGLVHWDTTFENISDLDFSTLSAHAAGGPFAPPPSSQTPAQLQAAGGPAMPTASSRPQTHISPHTNYSPTSLTSEESLFVDDLFGDELDPDTAQTSFSENMASSRKRSAGGMPIPPITKKQRPSHPDKHTKSKRQPTTLIQQDEDCFEDEASAEYLTGEDDLPTIDLTEANEVPEELLKPEEDNRVKISAFQCVICMDDATSLTVTHCGHLYCAQCLHSSLNVEATKGKCPMCRSKIELRPRKDYNGKTKGFWPLELKLMRVAKKGKQKAVAAQ